MGGDTWNEGFKKMLVAIVSRGIVRNAHYSLLAAR